MFYLSVFLMEGIHVLSSVCGIHYAAFGFASSNLCCCAQLGMIALWAPSFCMGPANHPGKVEEGAWHIDSGPL